MSHATENILDVTGQNWWAVGLRGIAAIIFGILSFLWPGVTLFMLVLLFGTYAIVDGVFAFVSAYRTAENRDSAWPFLVEGILGIITGIVAFVWPGITAVALLFLIAVWSIVTGAFELYAAVKLREEIDDEWWLALGGLVSVVFGLLLVFLPGPGALAVIWLIAAYAIVFGALLLALAWRLRRWQADERAATEATVPT
ncbi:HdeD family acid-resistance protein [Natrinema soli]|uniref:HdeD family acid-resistance protein n=1 Tax=Natrinema soli TaxID=1930624 RepID=A0ABD5SJP6_9EURY|nr:HdeD family acid-resistance protein [Natrinema soli]